MGRHTQTLPGNWDCWTSVRGPLLGESGCTPQPLQKVVPEEEEDEEGSAVLGPSGAELGWGPASARAELAFCLFHLPVVPPEVFLPRQILDTKWESVIQKNTNRLWSNVTAETTSHM